MKSVYSAVRNGSLNKAVCASCLNGYLHSRTGRDETKRRPRKGWREEAERDLQVLGVRRWRELVIDKEK